MPRSPLFNDFPDDLGCSGTVCWWKSHFQITRKIDPVIRLLADQTQSTAERGLVESKAMAGPQVSQIEHQIVDWIVLLLERGRDRQALSLIEKAKEDTAPRRPAGLINQSELPPGKCGRRIEFHSLALRAKIAPIANFRIVPLGLRVCQPFPEFIEVTLRAKTVETESRNR